MNALNHKIAKQINRLNELNGASQTSLFLLYIFLFNIYIHFPFTGMERIVFKGFNTFKVVCHLAFLHSKWFKSSSTPFGIHSTLLLACWSLCEKEKKSPLRRSESPQGAFLHGVHRTTLTICGACQAPLVDTRSENSFHRRRVRRHPARVWLGCTSGRTGL